MPESGFTATGLWGGTLVGRVDDEYGAPRERLRSSYLSLRENARILLAESAASMPSFTVHDISHVDALWETASMVCGDINGLTPAAAYVLGCAFVLHDAAMGLPAYPDGLPAAVGEQRWRDMLAHAHFRIHERWPEPAELDRPSQAVLDTCRVTALREQHAEQAAQLVSQGWKTSSDSTIHLIEDVGLRESYGQLIGELAASHWWDASALPERFREAKGSLGWQPAAWIIEPLKLACILRLADATQLDGRRAPTFLLALRRPAGESLAHWQFQEHMTRPRLVDDRVRFTSFTTFGPEKSDAWWLALDYLRAVDLELKRVDALLADLGLPRLAARAVANVDSPLRFSQLFEVRGWRPVDAAIQVSDIPTLVETLGGRQLYGHEPEVAVRELIQNAHDAVVARSVIEPGFSGGVIHIVLREDGGTWVLEVRDNGIGMDEDMLIHGLLDFGRSGWRTSSARSAFPGLAGGGFQPRGRFGIGFFSVFMIGDRVELTTRRCDGSSADARHLEFQGLGRRPLLKADVPGWPPIGTTARVVLKEDPFDSEGILRATENDRLLELVQRLVLSSSVPISVQEPDGTVELHKPFDLATASPAETFDRLYPPLTDSWRVAFEKQRQALREVFVQRATEVLDDAGQRIGLAAFGPEIVYWTSRNHTGIVCVNGFWADKYVSFAGYFEGIPSRASRDNVELAASRENVRNWFISQEKRLRDTGNFTPPIQLDLAWTVQRVQGRVARDHSVGMSSQGVMALSDIARWAKSRNAIFLAAPLPLDWSARPPQVIHYTKGVNVRLPENWLISCGMSYDRVFLDMFPPSMTRDHDYEFARSHRELTWEKFWWRISSSLDALLIKEICEAWSCALGDVLAPVAERHWSDAEQLEEPDLGTVFGYWLRRPESSR